MSAPSLAQRAAAVRQFNRFYTRQIGLLASPYLASPFSLTEARVVYELAQHAGTTAAELGRTLGLDAGYLSRMLRGFQRQGLLRRQPSPADARQSLLRLTPKGQRAFQTLNDRSQHDLEAMLRPLPAASQARLVQAMGAIEQVLGAPATAPAPAVLRGPRPGDLGWVVERHGAVYAEEYGWGASFEGLVAEIVAGFVQHYDPQRERCWIAELNGQNVGSVFVVKKTDAVAKLRLLLVEPAARGQGLGRHLVQECLGFARQAGYRQMTLWTNNVLVAARRIYAQAGFRLVASGPNHDFGEGLIEETWLIDL